MKKVVYRKRELVNMKFRILQKVKKMINVRLTFLESSMRKKKAPTMSKDQYNKLLESHLNFQKKHKDFFNAKASGLGALPLYKTPSDGKSIQKTNFVDTVANYQEIPVCGLDPRGVFYYPHVKIQYDESGEKVKSKKVSCRKKIKRIKELGKYVRSEDSKVITGRNKKTVKFILGGFEGRRKTGEPETFGIKDFLKLLKVKNSKAPAKDDLKHIQLRLLRRIVRVFWEIPTDVAEDMKRAEIEDAIIENWKNRNLDVEISIKGEVREKAKRTKETTGKRKRTSTKEASSRKTKRAKE